jgi:3-hydroxyisobutyrate dehydrogenase
MELNKVESLDKLLYTIKQQLIDGVRNRNNPYHYITIASVNEESPEIRMVVNRLVDFDKRLINFHTDFRSPKINQLKQNPNVGLLFYNIETKMQLRIKAVANIHHKDEVAKEKWEKTRNLSRLCYMHQLTPGSEVVCDWEKNKALDNGTNKEGYENFAVISCKFSSIDCMILGHENHRRFLFEWSDKNQLMSKEIAP